MQKAIEQAEIAAMENEVPVGAVIVRNDEIVATGRNRREQGKNALLHAETDAIYNACQRLGGWRLWNCEIYVTLEPCPMCAGAIINAHIPKVYFGAYDLKNGACGTITNLFQMPFNFKPESVGGIMQEECSKLLTNFFKNLRNKKSPSHQRELEGSRNRSGTHRECIDIYLELTEFLFGRHTELLLFIDDEQSQVMPFHGL